jgi:hypothetical protein
MNFATLEPIVVARLASHDWDPHIITGKDVRMVAGVLRLERMDADELTATRNAIVRAFGDASHDVMESNGRDGDWDRLHNGMSAITAVIDQYLWKAGALF